MNTAATPLLWVSLAAIVLISPRLANSAVGLLDIDGEASEIRWAAAIHSDFEQPTNQNPQHTHITLRICTNPLEQWKNGCLESSLVSPPLSREAWLKRIETFLNLNQLKKADLGVDQRQLAIQWTRDRVREKMEIGSLTPAGKEKLENTLNAMLDTVEPSHREQQLALRESVLSRWKEWLTPPTQLFDEVLFKAVEPISVDAALSPFSNWVFQSVCRCELVANTGIMDEPVCVLKKADKILATSKASISDCADRAACADQDWQKDFAQLTKNECNGYYTVGSMVPTLSEGWAEVQQTHGQ
jgi:hypothetical protein